MWRQAAALKVGEGDTFVAITEGGETSSVLGSLKYAAGNGARCFLVFNNPADLYRVVFRFRTQSREKRGHRKSGHVTILSGPGLL